MILLLGDQRAILITESVDTYAAILDGGGKETTGAAAALRRVRALELNVPQLAGLY